MLFWIFDHIVDETCEFILITMFVWPFNLYFAAYKTKVFRNVNIDKLQACYRFQEVFIMLPIVPNVDFKLCILLDMKLLNIFYCAMLQTGRRVTAHSLKYPDAPLIRLEMDDPPGPFLEVSVCAMPWLSYYVLRIYLLYKT